MISPQIVLVAIILVMAILYITQWISSEATSLLVIFALIVTGILSPEEAFSGFSSTATVTIGAMFVLSAGLLRTGALEAISIYMVRFAGQSFRRMILLMGLFIPATSAFINNTPVVIMMVPILLSVCRRLDLQPSKLMIPLSYLSILGGTATLLGTSTNILVDDLYRKAGGPGFGLFEFMPLGLIFTAIGTVYLVLFSRDILPVRAPLTSLVSNRRHTPYVTELTVNEGNPLIGQSITEAFPAISSFPPDLVEKSTTIFRPSTLFKPSEPIPPAQHQEPHAVSSPHQEGGSLELLGVYRDAHAFLAEETLKLTFQQGDQLLVAGTPDQLEQFMTLHSLDLATVLEDDRRVPMADLRQKVVEAVVLPDSSMIGRLVSEIGLHQRYQVNIMGLRRFGQQFSSGLRAMRLQSGDVFLLQGLPEMLSKASEEGRLMVVDGVSATITRSHKNRISLLIMAIVVVAAVIGPMPIGGLALAGVALLLITNCLNLSEAVDSINVGTLLLLAATIPLGSAIDSTGMAQTIVDFLLSFSQETHPVIFLSVFYLITNLLTQLLSNNAVAVLFTPISLTLAVQLGIDPKPLLMAIAFGASASFMTPMGYQTNAIVMGPGGYTFSDYLRLGIPLSIIMWLTATIFIPIFWPL